MKKETTNIIALKSKMWITNSLLELMGKKDFTKISIKEIIDNADLTRQTFYRNFNSKEDVLYEYVSKLYKECFDKIDQLPNKNLKTILITYFEYWYKYKELLILARKSNFNYKFMDFYYPFMNEYFEKFIIKLPDNFDMKTDYIKHFLLGGLIQVKTYWAERNFLETPEELAELVLQSINTCTYKVNYNIDTK
ncbi:TetR/AcrR family transcriptional regulator (plasmid) [Paraclostridium ghonii]|uniref:TetR/AcrR family transcriptional regulator n=1 Tax=Paraclostridium ghonii TaxID=29358 RepID=UPI00202CCDE3|nr:TetR/AcrR family transcriptional regulator [Paeniclostridium ghonii]MCM0167646.1 TetR/AcrR family transcriptional regulator [Paeniclostridium ghonii]